MLYRGNPGVPAAESQEVGACRNQKTAACEGPAQ